MHSLTQRSHADQGEATWREAVVMFNTAPSSVTIRGVRGGASRAEPFGDIAIDDVQVCQCVDVQLFACVHVDLSLWGQRDDLSHFKYFDALWLCSLQVFV